MGSSGFRHAWVSPSYFLCHSFFSPCSMSLSHMILSSWRNISVLAEQAALFHLIQGWEHSAQAAGLRSAVCTVLSCSLLFLCALVCCIPDSAFISPLVLSAKEQALCFLLGVTVNQPVFMRCKQQAKEFLVECIEVHGHDSEGEWLGSVTMPGKVTGRSLLFHIRAVWIKGSFRGLCRRPCHTKV